jgi:hypothetical protein
MKITDRLDALEKAMTTHLEESGEIKADLKWLKKALWLVLASPMVTEVVHRVWK